MTDYGEDSVDYARKALQIDPMLLTLLSKSARILPVLVAALIIGGCESDTPDQQTETVASKPCQSLMHREAAFTVCTFPASADIRLFHSDPLGQPYLQFDALVRELGEQGETLVFAMNGGMYHEDRSPVGYYRDAYGDRANLNLNDGPGNFHLKPNGVFWIKSGRAGVLESEAYAKADIDPTYATQSGPMLVIDGEIHPALNPEGVSRKRRNGVGVSADGQTVHFAISDSAVTFHEFASLFQTVLETPNALFLDGQVSRLYAPSINRNEIGSDLGPIVGIVE
ncbi:MAG: phosphodiester glycosidase family protein [Pseudomonadota bacterium]